jgi:class 3 adenylate cyclase/tetratricopeptide (TPR) repeat protein
MQCPKCLAENPVGQRFCGQCGAALSNRCPRCGNDNIPANRFCGRCGARLDTAAQLSVGSTASAAETTDDTLAGERKVVTALFADLKGSTELLETVDPEEGRAIVEPLLRIMSDAVCRYEGYVVRTTGDGIFALFGAPVACEDHPQRALYAALQMQQELRAQVQAQAVKGRPALEARVGVHTGEVVAYESEASGKVEYRLIGHTANLAARMESIAAVGSVAVSEATAELCEGYFELRGLGPTTVKGVSTPVNVYEVLGRGPLRTHFELSTRRGLTRFVGRERELEQMRHALEQSMASHGQIVAVVAEAGTGKSRLFYEFKATIPAECKVLEAYSVSHGKASAWLPVLELLHGYFGITETDDAASRRDKVRAALTGLDPALEDALPYLFGLLGIVDGPDAHAQMDARIKRQRTLDAIKRLILRDSLRQPLVVIFEDLHWIDEQTQGLLDLLADSVASARMLLLFNYRPEYHHGCANKSYYSQVRLEPLTGADGAAMLTAMLGEGDQLSPLKRLIVERTGGNPFFIEEIVQGLFEDGALVRNGTVRITRSLSQLRLPPTVQGMLAARVDRLPRPQKDLLQTLAVIGREARLRLVREVTSAEDMLLSENLADLCSAEFIHEQPVTGDTEFVFKHALTQEVAYNSLLIERRKVLHERIGYALESLFGAQLDDHLTELGHHYSHSANLDKAIEFLGRAGQQAMQRSAHSDAIARLSEAVKLLQKLPNGPERSLREFSLQLALGQAFMPEKGWSASEVERPLKRVAEICDELGSLRELFPASFGLWSVNHVRGNFGPARDYALQLLERAKSFDDRAFFILAHYAVGQTMLLTGELAPAREHQERMLSLYDPKSDLPLMQFVGMDFKQGISCYKAWTLWLLGYPDQAVATAEAAVALARALSHPFSPSTAEFFLHVIHNLRRDYVAAQEVAERVFAYSTEHGFGLYLLAAPRYRAWAVIQQGSGGEAEIAQQREGLETSYSVGLNIARSHGLYMLAQSYEKIGQLDYGLSALNEALVAVDEQTEHWWEPEIWRLRGELLLEKDSSHLREAQTCFERALDIARAQRGRSLELRATTSLARLLRDTGRREEAGKQLAEIYNWFTEGFDTADLKDAKALLDEL